VRFGDTDAAGVMHFHQLLRWCHEAYEESLERFGISSAEIFPAPGHPLKLLLPITQCSADFLAPLVCGDPLAITLQPLQLDPTAFEVSYRFSSDGKPVAQGLTRHQCISASERKKTALSEGMAHWLQASAVSPNF
jgi:1,4-dihydroxy-2-naphthoyl-CoA hydrolase